ncbi:MAG: hypothetical protein E6244_01495 [Actinomyces sp.]|nr:hypothetical protein [Pauljensenia sp. UMB10120]MDK6242230.1 hypothetical protein [Pauljensenia sp. UMB10120]MDU5114690.1 hypothetical protein [Actinomyces sp.]
MNAATLTRPDTTEPTLRAVDRCDACGARAWVRVTMASGPLLFCAHHARLHMDALRDSALRIDDERHLMDQS